MNTIDMKSRRLLRRNPVPHPARGLLLSLLLLVGSALPAATQRPSALVQAFERSFVELVPDAKTKYASLRRALASETGYTEERFGFEFGQQFASYVLVHAISKKQPVIDRAWCDLSRLARRADIRVSERRRRTVGFDAAAAARGLHYLLDPQAGSPVYQLGERYGHTCVAWAEMGVKLNVITVMYQPGRAADNRAHAKTLYRLGRELGLDGRVLADLRSAMTKGRSTRVVSAELRDARKRLRDVIAKRRKSNWSAHLEVNPHVTIRLAMWRFGREVASVGLSAANSQRSLSAKRRVCERVCATVGTKLPPLRDSRGRPITSGSRIERVAKALNYALRVAGPKLGAAIDRKYGQAARVSFEIGLRTMLAGVLYEDNDLRETSATTIRRLGEKSRLPSQVWKPLVAAMTSGRPKDDFIRELVAINRNVDAYLKASRTKRTRV